MSQKNIYNVEWLDIVPHSLKEDKEIAELVKAISPELRTISNQIKLNNILENIDDLPESTLDHLIFVYHIDYSDTSLSADQKRQLLKNVFESHKYKGTKYAVKLMMDTIFNGSQVEEWFEYGGEPYHFRVSINGSLVDAQNDAQRAADLIDKVKNARSVFDGVSVNSDIDFTRNYSMYLSQFNIIEINFETIAWSESTQNDSAYSLDSATSWSDNTSGRILIDTMFGLV